MIMRSYLAVLAAPLAAAQVQQVNCCEYPYAPEMLGQGGCVGGVEYRNTVRPRR